MSKSQTNNLSGIVSFTIKVSGQAIPDTISILSIAILKQFNEPSLADVTILIGNVLDQDLLDNLSTQFDIGKTISIELGYDQQDTLVFSGTVSGQSLSINTETGTLFKINCVAPTIKEIENTDLATTSGFVATYGLNIYELIASINNDLQYNVSGSFKTQGTSIVSPNNLIELNGVGQKFDGNHLVNKIRHAISNGDWYSEIFFG